MLTTYQNFVDWFSEQWITELSKRDVPGGHKQENQGTIKKFTIW